MYVTISEKRDLGRISIPILTPRSTLTAIVVVFVFDVSEGDKVTVSNTRCLDIDCYVVRKPLTLFLVTRMKFLFTLSLLVPS